MEARQRNVTFVIAILGIAVVVVAGILLERPIREYWLISELENDSFDTRKRSALELGKMKSLRAVSKIVQLRPPPNLSSTLSRSGNLKSVFTGSHVLPHQSTVSECRELLTLLTTRVGPLKREQIYQKGPNHQFIVQSSPYVTTRVRLEVEALNTTVEVLREGGLDVQAEVQRLVDEEGADTSLREAARVILRALKRPRQR